ncbi:MAG: NAD(+) synthase [Bacteroidales bacterium]
MILFCIFASLNLKKMTHPTPDFFPFLSSEQEMEELTSVIRTTVNRYVRRYALQSLVLGISGGIDSALCAALLRPVCEENRIPLIGRSITIETNREDEIIRSIQVGENFCHDFTHLDLTPTFLENKKNLICYDDSRLSKMRQGNMKARMRMMILFDLAQLYRGLVISTDNYTEYLTGFWTLHGDVGDYAPIMNLWKTEVYNLANFLLPEGNALQREALQACIEATPVDGLGISQCDCEQLGVCNYFEADEIFIEYFNGNKKWEDHALIKRYKASEYKRNNPANIPRMELIKSR